MGKKVGRPSKFKEEYIADAYSLCLLGLTDAQLADRFEVCESTINDWKQTKPGFMESLKKGKHEADARVAGAMYEHAIGAEWVEEQAIKCRRVDYGENGKRLLEEEHVEIVQVTRRAPPDTTAGIFWLKNRQPQIWRDRHQVEYAGPDGGPITIIQADEAKERLFERLAGIAERVMERLDAQAIAGHGDGAIAGDGTRSLPPGANGAGAASP